MGVDWSSMADEVDNMLSEGGCRGRGGSNFCVCGVVLCFHVDSCLI